MSFDEIIHFAQISRKEFGYAKAAICETDSEKFEELRKKLVKYEEITDHIEYEIATFLNAVSAENLSEASSMKVKAMYKIIGELESLGDSGETISRILSRRDIHKKVFDVVTIKNLGKMAETVESAYEAMFENLEAAHKGTLSDISNAYNAENRINNLRSILRDTEIEGIEDGSKNYLTSVYYIDVVNQLERMGDFIINISQDLKRSFSEK